MEAVKSASFKDNVVFLMPQTKCQVEVRVRKRAAYFRIIGNLDQTIPSPKSIVAKATGTQDKLAILDLTSVTNLDSEGLELLERLAAYAEGEGVRVRIVAPLKTKARRILELVRFDRFLFIATSVMGALRYNRRAGSKTTKAPGKA